MSDLTVFTFKDKKFSVLASKNWLGLSSDEENEKTEEKDSEKPNMLTLAKIQKDEVRFVLLCASIFLELLVFKLISFFKFQYDQTSTIHDQEDRQDSDSSKNISSANSSIQEIEVGQPFDKELPCNQCTATFCFVENLDEHIQQLHDNPTDENSNKVNETIDLADESEEEMRGNSPTDDSDEDLEMPKISEVYSGSEAKKKFLNPYYYAKFKRKNKKIVKPKRNFGINFPKRQNHNFTLLKKK